MKTETWEQIHRAREILENAEAVLITASNGLSITEGLHLFAHNTDFVDLVGDLAETHGFYNLLQGFFYPWESAEAQWGFYSRVLHRHCGQYTASPAMKNLRRIVGEKPYFVVTSNAEGHFQLAGFSEAHLYEVETSWLKMRCGNRCHDTVYPTMDTIEQLAALETGGVVPTAAVPRCPKCGAVMALYETDPAEETVLRHWNAFLSQIHGKRFVVLELGIGSRNTLIKAPTMALVAREPHAAYVTVNLGDIRIPAEIASRSVGIDGDLQTVLQALAPNLL